MSDGIRLLTADDAAAMHVLHAASFPPAEAWSAWAFQDTFALKTTIGAAAERDGQLAGMVIAQKVPPEADILTMCVHPDQRRRGLATELLNGLCGLLGPYGIARLSLDVAADNDPALTFYGRMGFLEDGRRTNYYQRQEGMQMDAILMSRPIAGHSVESEA